MAATAFTIRRTISPTVDTSAYADGDNIGGTEYQLSDVVNYTNGGFAWCVVVRDYAEQTPGFTMLFFSAEPSNTTLTDNSALTIADADLANCIGFISVESADYYALTGNSIAFKSDVGVAYVADADDLWVVLVADGAFTFGASTDLDIDIFFRMD